MGQQVDFEVDLVFGLVFGYDGFVECMWDDGQFEFCVVYCVYCEVGVVDGD